MKFRFVVQINEELAELKDSKEQIKAYTKYDFLQETVVYLRRWVWLFGTVTVQCPRDWSVSKRIKDQSSAELWKFSYGTAEKVKLMKRSLVWELHLKKCMLPLSLYFLSTVLQVDCTNSIWPTSTYVGGYLIWPFCTVGNQNQLYETKKYERTSYFLLYLPAHNSSQMTAASFHFTTGKWNFC